MSYTLRKDYNNFRIFEDKKLPSRAYFVPFENQKNCKDTKFYEERQKSKLVTMLSGEWDFAFFERISAMPNYFDSDEMKFSTINVPCCWQNKGFEAPFYVNSKYMFDFFPPNVPSDEGTIGKTFVLNNGKKIQTVFNTCGVYRKKFKYKPTNAEIITFLGVSSCLELHINGEYVGYSEGSHNSAEFDITEFLNDGENEILAVVYKWCNGTYLECQDMFRCNGIFRDVYMTALSNNYIYDVHAVTEQIDKNKWKLSVVPCLKKQEGAEVVYELYYGESQIAMQQSDVSESDKHKMTTGNGKDIAGKAVSEKCNNITISLDDVKTWSAEIPNLYTLYVKIVKDGKEVFCIRQEIGFKTIKIVGNIFYFNDKAIKLKGVNHHDNNPKTGYYMSEADIRKDCELMKELNVNTVRTSHYPPDPIFLKFANYYGLYIVDEADIETHGTYAKKCPTPNVISNSPKWKAHFWDRVERMYGRDKNNVCVVMWSLGNESGGWKNQDYCYKMLKALDKSTPIHYEGVCRTPRFSYDVVSKMYDSTDFVEKYVNKKLPKKYYKAPYFLCEYAHSMGLGPGSLDFYWKQFYKEESVLGACIWEWSDHAVLHDDGKYTYGGDHGEYVHDKNFCTDGLVYPDRTPSTSAYNMQAVYRPISAYYVSNNKYVLRNRNYFVDSSIYDIEWNYLVNGEIVSKGLVVDNIPPNSENVITINHPQMDTSKDCFVNFITKRKSDGKTIAKEQIILCKNIKFNKAIGSGSASLVASEQKIIVDLDGGQIVFDKTSGHMQQYKFNNLEIIGDIGAIPSVYRKPIDNFMYVRSNWEKLGLDKKEFSLVSIEPQAKEQGKVVVTAKYEMTLLDKSVIICVVEYTIYGNGVIDVDVVYNTKKPLDAPCFGVKIAIPNEFENIKYYGYGDRENYSDFKAHSSLGIYESKTADMYEKYIMPQESGNRTKVKWLAAKNKEGDGFIFRSIDKSLNMSALPYEDSQLMEAKHRDELKSGERTIIKVDGFVRGVGSNSCGEDTRKEFINAQAEVDYKFQIAPLIVVKKK